MGKFTSKLGKRKTGGQTAAAALDDVNRAIDAVLRRADGRVALRLVDAVAKHVDASAREAPEASRWACAPGCNFCCHLVVIATPPELRRVAAAIREHPDAAALRERILTNAARIEELDEDQLFAARIPCALLGVDGRCTIYEARPLACRGHVSFSREVCEAAHEDPFAEVEADADPAMQRARTDADTHVAGTLIAVGLDAMGYELHDGLARALELGPDEWLEPAAFSSCRTVSERVEFVREVYSVIADES